MVRKSRGGGEKISGEEIVSQPVENIYQLLAKTEETIQELSKLLAECGILKRGGLDGSQWTPQQLVLRNELEEARRRADILLGILQR